jgi:uncharacterized OsmC-like protein
MKVTAKKTVALNGVDTERLSRTIEAIRADPQLAGFQFRVRNGWLRGGHNRTEVKGFFGAGQEDLSRERPFLLDSDEPDVLLGTDLAANPVEYLLHALAGCLTTTMVYHAAARGIRLESVESKIEGNLDLRGFLGLSKAVPVGFQSIRVEFLVKADVSDEVLGELGRIAQAHSPVYNTLTRGVPVTVRAERA